MIKKNSLNATRCGNLLHLEMNTFLVINSIKSVKTSLTRAQPAWLNNPSETQRGTFSTLQKSPLNPEFFQWFVGVVDGDGSFSFNSYSNSWQFCFTISQSSYNCRLLYFIKSNLRVGKINIVEQNGAAQYRVRDLQTLMEHILPIFEKYPLLTYKYLLFDLFRKALLIKLSKPDNWFNQIKELKIEYNKIKILSRDCKSNELSKSIRSPVWKTVSDCFPEHQVKKIMTKAWLVGFTEAEGSFYIYKHSKRHMVHAFEINQKHDAIVLQAITVILPVKLVLKKTYIQVISSTIDSNDKISNYFFKTMKGMKALEFRLWSRSFNKRKRGFEYLQAMQRKMRQMRSIKRRQNLEKRN